MEWVDIDPEAFTGMEKFEERILNNCTKHKHFWALCKAITCSSSSKTNERL